MDKETQYMTYALKLAKIAFKRQEVPVGAIIVSKDKIVARGHNKRLKTHVIDSHAELNVIRKANKKIKDFRLEDATLYVTLYPCPMCASAIVQSRIKRVVIGAPTKVKQDKEIAELIFKTGNVEIIENVLKEECSEILTRFFKEQRNK